MGIDYLEAAKNQILAIEGEHPVEEVNARMLTAIADVLVHIAMKDERTCSIDSWGGDSAMLTCGHEAPGYAKFCPSCGAKVVE